MLTCLFYPLSKPVSPVENLTLKTENFGDSIESVRTYIDPLFEHVSLLSPDAKIFNLFILLKDNVPFIKSSLGKANYSVKKQDLVMAL